MSRVQRRNLILALRSGAFRPSRLEVALAFFGIATVHALLSQIPAATLSDMAAAKNGFVVVGLLALAAVQLLPTLRDLDALRRSPSTQDHLDVLAATRGPWWVVAFVCLVYSHALIWLSAVAAGLIVSLYDRLAEDRSERSTVLRLLGFSVATPLRAPKAPNGIPREQALILGALVLGLGSQAYLVMSPSSTLPFWLYVAPLHVLAICLGLGSVRRMTSSRRAAAL